MELKFLGIGSAFNPALKNTSAYFIHNQNFFLIDCGESVFEQIYWRDELRDCKAIYVLTTHLHADHVGSLGSLISYCNYVLKKEIHVIYPIETIVELLALLGIDNEKYQYHRKLPADLEGIEVAMIPVEHVKDMSCFGCLISTAGETSYYSGDASDIPQHILTDFLADRISRLYQDTSSHQTNHPTHCYIGRLEQLIPPAKRGMVYCMHLDCEMEATLRAKGFNVAEV